MAAPSVHNLIPFISQSIEIDGSKMRRDQATLIDGESCFQLRRARTEESRFDWTGWANLNTPKEVILKNVVILDEIDVQCLHWFIIYKIKIVFSQTAIVSPLALDALVNMLKNLKENVKVIEGSTMHLPAIAGGSRSGVVETAADLCRNLGFQIVRGFRSL